MKEINADAVPMPQVDEIPDWYREVWHEPMQYVVQISNQSDLSLNVLREFIKCHDKPGALSGSVVSSCNEPGKGGGACLDAPTSEVTDPDSATVERVARAIWEVLDCKEEGRERLKVYAKAAISAINQGDK